ncbi:hypothetical protein Nepgr_007648 [Nepenthes gracilis]|uniref:Uncharacterized protein n=1 Tax=Nepenthes gracilis TaxID=150966 RepID=A0AAD3S797_NEPGR|nr:hypothetical protein Nepgr_007648 [Nepenthes gracilis]
MSVYKAQLKVPKRPTSTLVFDCRSSEKLPFPLLCFFVLRCEERAIAQNTSLRSFELLEQAAKHLLRVILRQQKIVFHQLV